MSGALFEASWEGLKCLSAGLHSSSVPFVPQCTNTFFRRRALRVHSRLQEDQGHSAFAQRSCRDGQVKCKVQAFRREGGPALADLHIGSRGQLYGNVNGVDVSGGSTAGREDLSPLQLKAERSNGAGRSSHASDNITGADRLIAKDFVANGAASFQGSRAGDPAAGNSQGPASASEEVMQGADEPAASASNAKSRLQMDLDRQRSKEGVDLAMRTRKEVLRQLRTGEEEGLPEAERLRRLRISAANKGRAPWNVGKKHTLETIEKIRKGTTEAMRDPNVRQRLRAFHGPKMQPKSIREKISRGVILTIMRKQGMDVASLTEEQVNALFDERKAKKQAEAEARQARQAKRQQDMEARQRLEEQNAAFKMAQMLSDGLVERLRNGNFPSATVSAAEKPAAPKRRKAAKKAAVEAAPEQASDADSSAAEALPKQAPARRRPAVPGAATAAAKKRAAAEAAAAAGEARAGQLKRALMLVIKLEEAVQQCYKHQEATVRSASTEERERVEDVVANAQNQLLRAKGQVARLQPETPISNAFSPEEMDALSRILSDSGSAASRPALARFKRALAHDRGGRAGFARSADASNGAAADAVLDIEAERL